MGNTYVGGCQNYGPFLGSRVLIEYDFSVSERETSCSEEAVATCMTCTRRRQKPLGLSLADCCSGTELYFDSGLRA